MTAGMDKSQAKQAIQDYFAKHKACMSETLNKSTGGKIYELYCLAKTLEWLRSTYSVNIQLVNGAKINFKASPGNIDRSRSYFAVSKHGIELELHTDIQIKTLGADLIDVEAGRSGYHEIDIVLIYPDVPDKAMPGYDQLVLGVECKSQEKFDKGVVKQVLGIRRELSYLAPENLSVLERYFGPMNSTASGNLSVNANPASLYWLAYIDQKGDQYAASPSAFSIDFKRWQP